LEKPTLEERDLGKKKKKNGGPQMGKPARARQGLTKRSGKSLKKIDTQGSPGLEVKFHNKEALSGNST